ncbi:hypothetical protein [Ahrensia sp. R2A130]|uniref:hypothetical protein n=1 Tax=Ahrensia sp. R2A130 TaxID=744979 RepID=UPI0012EA00E0|nr:hypothetical protein [Ahrensia sp. R2A130]
MTMTQCRDAIRGNSNSTGSRVLELMMEHGLDADTEDETISTLEDANRARKIKNAGGSGKKYPY